MSTILKALQRLEDEKVADVEPSLDEQIRARRPPPRPARRRGLGIGIAAIGGLAVAAAAFLLWPNQEDSDAVVALDSPVAAAPVAAAAPEPALPAEPLRLPPARTAPERDDSAEIEVAALVEVVERLDAQPADTGAPAESPNRVAPTVETKQSSGRPGAHKPGTRVAREPDTRVAREPDTQLARAPEPQVAPESETQVADTAAQPRPAAERVSNVLPAAIQSAEPPVEPVATDSVSANTATAPAAPIKIAAVAPEPAPRVASESAPAPIRAPEQKIIQRAKVPALSIERTIWHPDTNRRIAIVKLSGTDEVLRLKEGDAIGPLVVESIKPGSVVFNHDGIEIRYNVGG